MTAVPDDLPVLPFADADAWEAWLVANADAKGVWLKIAKKDSGHATVTYAEALDVALCHGWIDGQKRGFDAAWFLQRFTPRRAKSLWSKINVGHVARLTAAGRMRAGGLREVEAAKPAAAPTHASASAARTLARRRASAARSTGKKNIPAKSESLPVSQPGRRPAPLSA